jgi:hypothetical protein
MSTVEAHVESLEAEIPVLGSRSFLPENAQKKIFEETINKFCQSRVYKRPRL